jgi:hypothetical protein
MLSPKPQLNLKSAKEYFREHLSIGDYYLPPNRPRPEGVDEWASRFSGQYRPFVSRRTIELLFKLNLELIDVTH